MLITVVLVNYNSSSDLLEAVESLEKSLIPKGFERQVVVVENSASEPEWERLQALKKYPDLELIKSDKNTGFTGGHNLGIKRGQELNSDFFLLLNPDTKVDKNFLVELLKPNPQGLASPKIYFYPGYEFHKDRYQKEDLGHVIWYAGGYIDWANCVAGGRHVDEVDHGQFSSEIQRSDFATGCGLLISRAVVEKIGFLDQKLFFSWEDTDYSERAKRAGFDVIYVPKSIVWHKNAGSSGGAGSLLQDFYQTRNRLIFAFRYASWKVKILLFWLLLKTANLTRLRAIASALLILI